MQREVKKTKSPVKPGLKIAKPVSAKISKQEKSGSFEKNAAALAGKTIRKLKAETPEKISLSIPKAKKSVTAQSVKKEKISAPKNKAVAAAEIVKKASPTISVKVSGTESKPKKSATVNRTAQQLKEKSSSKITVEKSKSKVKPILAKTSKTKVNIAAPPPIKTNSSKTAKVPEKKVKPVVSPSTLKPVKKKIKPIGSAVVRGKSGRYDFEVFPLDAELKDGSAIYVISKRITDKRGRGHHKFVCIGQTESLLDDLKKHKKDKCIKQHKANVICLLREENESNRLKIETDLRQAHTIFCNQK